MSGDLFNKIVTNLFENWSWIENILVNNNQKLIKKKKTKLTRQKYYHHIIINYEYIYIYTHDIYLQ